MVKKGGVCFEGSYATKKLVRSLPELSMYRKAPCRRHICNERELIGTKFLNKPFFSLQSFLLVHGCSDKPLTSQMRRRHGAYRNMNRTTMQRLDTGTNFLIVSTLSKQMPLFVFKH